MKVKILIAILLLLAAPSWATTYYVDNTSTGGDGTTTDTTGAHAAFATIAAANAQVLNPGDSILLKCGQVFYGRFLTKYSGSSGSPITYGAYSAGVAPILSAGVVRTGWAGPDGSGVYSLSSLSNIGNITEDDLTTGGMLLRASSSACSNGNWYFNSGTGIAYYKPTSGTPSDHTVTTYATTNQPFYLYTNFHYITIQDLTLIGYTAVYSVNVDATTDHIIVQRCTIRDSIRGFYSQSRAGYPTQNITIKNNTFSRNAYNIYFESDNGGDDTAYADTIVIQYNKFINTNEPYNAAVALSTGNDRDGFDAQNIRNSIIEYNEITGHCSPYGISLWATNGFAATNNIIRYNYIHDLSNAAGIICTSGGTSTGGDYEQIYSNIIINCAGNSSYSYGGLILYRGQDSTHKSQIYNNTIWNCVNGLDFGTGPNKNPADYFVVKNNIIGGNSGYNIKMEGTVLNNVFNYNNYYPATGNCFSYNGAAKTYLQWQGYCGEANSITTDSLLTSTYQLGSGSPTIGAGVDVGLSPRLDYFGQVYKSTPSIGANEPLGFKGIPIGGFTP